MTRHGPPVLSWVAALAAALVVAASASAAGAVGAAAPGMYVNFNANHTFLVTLVDGTVVGSSAGAPATLPAGAYQLYLNDTSGALMQFDLGGPGVSLVTNMTNAEDLAASYTETFQPSSTYTFRDDDAAGSPVFSFATSSTIAVPSPATTTQPAPSPAAGATTGATSGSTDIVGSATAVPKNRGKLTATVSTAGKLQLGSAGRSVTVLKTGRYTIAVVDRSRTAGFTLQETKRSARSLSGALFSGSRKLTLDLTPGQWFFYSNAISKKTYFLVTR
ncbi:MAG TPA: hypothetical protein VG265_09675 [Gaiellaceae bacterium]|nr:hypothetical protein [Gaiellaceae bacterium]